MSRSDFGQQFWSNNSSPHNLMDSAMEMSIPDFFRGRSIFVTGGSGFMGKVLIEKLLRSCPELETIYVLIRPKRGQQVNGRFTELLNTKIFDWLKYNHKSQLNKIVAVAGDITKPELGLSAEDQTLLVRNVSVVFHAAATVKFDEAIKLSVALNLVGTKSLLQLCERMEKLESVVHVSTAYCNCNLNEEVYERLYPAPSNPEAVIQMVNLLDDGMLSTITPMLLNDRPNTYTYTKALAEHVVYEMSKRLPIAIFRPSIVTGAIKEPLTGWIDNLNGPTGLVAGVGKGVLRSVICHKNNIADFIPVDMAINCMIAIAWHTAVSRPSEIFYNCATGASNPLYWRDLEKLGIQSILKYPCKEMMWYPGGSFKSSPLLNEVHTIVSQVLPAYIYDGLAKLFGRKPTMVRLQEKMKKALVTIRFFTTKQFRFRNDRVLELYSQLSSQDQKVFSFDINGINWKNYIDTYVLGTREFVLKEDSSTLSEGRVNLRKLYILHRCTQLLMFTFVLWGVVLRSSTARVTVSHIVSLMFKTITTFTRVFSSLER